MERYRSLAFGTALALLGDYHLAEDAVQEALWIAHRSRERLRDPAKLGAWLRGIVRYRCFRLLRTRDLGHEPLPELASPVEPWQHAVEHERRERLLDRVRALPPPLREVVALHHLQGCPQREVAAFLGLTVATVNNRLFKARQLLRGTIVTRATPEIGTVVRVAGAVVDVRFDKDAVPDVFDALAAAGASPDLRVMQILGEGLVRCLGKATVEPGSTVVNATATGGTWSAAPAGDEELAQAVATLGQKARGHVTTGIKPIDLFAPLPQEGNVALCGTVGTGKMVLVRELAHRLRGGPRLFYLASRSEPSLVRDLRREGEEFDRDVVWLTSERATDPDFARETRSFDASLYLSPLLGIRGLWPAVDPFRSRSSVVLGDRHSDLARRSRSLLAEAKRRTADPVLLELLACNAPAAARRRLQEAGPPADPVVLRAHKLELFMTTPFFVAEEVSGIPGCSVPLEDTLSGVEAILDGACDHVPDDDLYLKGALAKD
jgi:RNA polymerase sigma factor (sigma-70 family)